MAFKVWIDDDKVTSTNVLSASDFEGNTDRQSGFKANSAASAKNVNSAVRQANLISVALMQSMGITDLNLTSSVNAVKTAIDTYFTNAFAKKLDTTGDAKNAKVTFTAGSTGQLTSGNSLSSLFGTLAAWCASFGSLAKKSTVGTQDIVNKSVNALKLASESVTTEKFDSNAKAPYAGTADSALATGLSNTTWTNATVVGDKVTLTGLTKCVIEVLVEWSFAYYNGNPQALCSSFFYSFSPSKPSITKYKNFQAFGPALSTVNTSGTVSSSENALKYLVTPGMEIRYDEAADKLYLDKAVVYANGSLINATENFTFSIDKVSYRILK